MLEIVWRLTDQRGTTKDDRVSLGGREHYAVNMGLIVEARAIDEKLEATGEWNLV